LTVIDLGLPKAVRQSLQTTNLIESPFSVVRQVARNVKRWRNRSMAERWAALGLIEAEKRFRRIRGYRDLPMLVATLKKETALDKSMVAQYHELGSLPTCLCVARRQDINSERDKP
jgi:transposase-like protein